MNFHDIPFLSTDFLHRNENMTHDEIVDLPMKDGDFPKLFVWPKANRQANRVPLEASTTTLSVTQLGPKQVPKRQMAGILEVYSAFKIGGL